MGWMEEPEDDWMDSRVESEIHTLLCEVKMKLSAAGKFDQGWKHVEDLEKEARDGSDEFEHMREILQLSDLHVAALQDDYDFIRDDIIADITASRGR